MCAWVTPGLPIPSPWRKTHHEFVVGTWVTVELGKDTGLDWRLIHERVMMKPSRDAMLRRESGLRRVVGFGPDWMEDGTWFALRPEGKPDVPGDAFLAALRNCPPPPTSPWPSASRRPPPCLCHQPYPGPKGIQPRPAERRRGRGGFSPRAGRNSQGLGRPGIKLHAPRAHHENGQRLVAHEVYAHMGRPAHAL
ncbi:hypothetical protein M5E87_12055 [Flavonifractor plautii]|nr:hypothetical protein M5E87_12055 [Flavonifractor plautii]